MKKNLKTKLLKYKYDITEILYFLIIDFFNKYLTCGINDIRMYFNIYSIIYSIFWISMFIIIFLILSPKIKKILLPMILCLLLCFTIVNYFFYNYFQVIISWRDIFLVEEGLTFVNSIYKFISFKFILFIFIMIGLILLICKWSKKEKFYFKKKSKIIITIYLILLFISYAKTCVLLGKYDDGWDGNLVLNNDADYYTTWTNPNKLIIINGTYNYILRDFYCSFIKKDNYKSANKFVENYFLNHEKEKLINSYTGLFKNKNLLLIQFENMDDWMINKKVTPTIYKLMKEGINFTNHYAPTYVTGMTANTEFIVNTGLYPKFDSISPVYAYVNNSYPYALANLFKEAGYITNSFHCSNGMIYNRSNMHLKYGYLTYNDYIKSGVPEEKTFLDSEFMDYAYNKIINKDLFMSLFISFTPHNPNNYNEKKCQKNLEIIKKLYPENNNEQYLCSLSAALETDNMFSLLLQRLEEDNLLDKTVIIAYADHPNDIGIEKLKNKNINKVPFFMWSNDLEPLEINDITSSIDVAPTIINLFDLENYYYYPGRDILDLKNKKGRVIFRNYTMYNGKNIVKITDVESLEIEMSKNLLISDYYKNK